MEWPLEKARRRRREKKTWEQTSYDGNKKRAVPCRLIIFNTILDCWSVQFYIAYFDFKCSPFLFFGKCQYFHNQSSQFQFYLNIFVRFIVCRILNLNAFNIQKRNLGNGFNWCSKYQERQKSLRARERETEREKFETTENHIWSV